MASPKIRYGVSLRKRYEDVQRNKRTRYECEVCGKDAVRRISTGIWKCKHCGATYAGGAYTLKTEAGEAARSSLVGKSSTQAAAKQA